MAIAKVSFFSNSLMRTVPFTAVLPNDGAIFPGQQPSFVCGDMRTLYLLHGFMGDETDYLVNTRVREFSEKYNFSGPDFQRRTFGDLSKLGETDLDPRNIYLDKKKAGAELPSIFMTEGSEDFLIDVNHKMRNFLTEQNADFTYIEDAGVHDWDFWNKHLEEAFQWLAI